MNDSNPVSNQPPDINDLIQQLKAKDEIIRNLQSADTSQNDLGINVPAKRKRVHQDLMRNDLESINVSQQLTNDLYAHVAKLSLQLDASNQKNMDLEKQVTESNEKISELTEQLNKTVQENIVLKTELVGIKESATVAINQDLQKRIADLSIAKKHVDDELLKANKKVAALVEYNSSLCEKTELSQKKLAKTVKLRRKEHAAIRDLITNLEYDICDGYERYSYFWWFLSGFYCDLGWYEEALQAVEKDIELMEDREFEDNVVKNECNATSFYRRGLIHENLGHHDEALLDFERAYEFDPNYEDAEAKLVELGVLDLDELEE